MKILLVADIHSNWEALSRVNTDCDACLFLGDLVDYGVDPLPCFDWVREHATACIRGNHDHAVAHRVPAIGGSGFRGLAQATRPRHWERLGIRDLSFLAKMPVTQRLELDGKSFYLVHGTPYDPLDEYLSDDADAWRMRLEGIDADYVCVGHTHIPFHLDLGDTQVINPGSVGQPRDGDPRLSFATIEDGRVEFHRVEYDVEAALKQVREVGVDGVPYETAERSLRHGGLKAYEQSRGNGVHL